MEATTNLHKSHTQAAKQAHSFQAVQAGEYFLSVVQLQMLRHVRVIWEVGQQHESPILANMRIQVIMLRNRVRHK